MPNSISKIKQDNNADSPSVASASAASTRGSEDASALTPRLGSRKSFLKLSNPAPSTPRSQSAHALLGSDTRKDTDTSTAIQKIKPIHNGNVLQSIPLPQPKPPSKCPLFCCFYAEFDNKVGPKVCFQTPKRFLHQEIDLPLKQVHEILAETFKYLTETSVTERTLNDEDVSQTETDDGESIFDSCSDFIITGSELTGNIINLSTHQFHVLSRPTVISNERYERNALHFCVGFVLRRTEDPRPFRPILSKLAITLAEMEDESQFMSSPSTRPMIQTHLERILVELNSPKWESNIMMTPANLLNVKLFHPPKTAAKSVPEYAVPILLRRDRHVHMYDWDLAINWVSLHIDGALNARQIAKVAEVDMEMVLSCLRVLRHHGVIALVDMFFFTNHYESTPKAAAMLAGKHPELLKAAAEYCCHGVNRSSHELSPSLHSVSSLHDHSRLEQTLSGSSSFPDDRHSFHVSPGYRSGTSQLSQQLVFQAPRHEASPALRASIPELYCACQRRTSIGDMWVNLLSRHSTREIQTPDWRKIFHTIDHRRFASFGLVHGLIRRLHNYPLIVGGTAPHENGGSEFALQVDSHTSGTVGRSKGTLGLPRQPIQHSNSGITEWTAEEVARLMDGRHCDDELVSTVGSPFGDLLELVAGRTIVSTFAPGSFF